MTGMQSNQVYHFGERIRKVREQKGLTLKQVAQKANVSESLISQIERNKVSPAIDTLLTIVDVLDINIEFLFEEYLKKHPVHVIYKNERRQITENKIVYEQVSNPSEKDGLYSMESYLITIPVGESTKYGSYGHIGKELGYIIEGNVELKYETSSYRLEEGDSISFEAASPHSLINIGDKDAKALWVVTPPKRFV